MFIQSIVFDKYMSEDHSNLTQDLDLSTPPPPHYGPYGISYKTPFQYTESCVRIGSNVTKCFQCKSGLRQEEKLKHTLSALFRTT